MKLRLFSAADGDLIAGWMVDPAYEHFFRMLAVLPTAEECRNYPQWSNQACMMVMDDLGHAVGMVTMFNQNFRSRSCEIGVLLSKDLQGKGLGHKALCLWMEYVTKIMGFQIVIVRIVEQNFKEPILRLGFREAGEVPCWVNGQFVEETRLVYDGR